MRLSRRVPTLAAVVALAGTAAPVASGHLMSAESGGPSVGGPQQTALVQRHSGDTTALVIGIATAGGLAVIGTGLAANRRRGRGPQPTKTPSAA
jgi:hypothetical protein